VLFYQLATGRLPYLAQDVSSLIHQHIAQVPDAPSKANNQIPPVIENIILRLIAKDPQDRYQSLSGLTFDLMEYQNQRSRGKQPVDFEIARFDKLRQLSFNTRLIGRDKELAELKGLLNKIKQTKGSLIFVFGEPGIGKSRLVDELRAHVYGLGGLFCGGKCYQYEFKTPYKVFSEAIDAYIEKVKRLSQEQQQYHIKRIKDVLGELGAEVVKIAPSITDIIGQPPKLVELDPEKEKIRFLITVTNFIVSLSTPQTPLLMFLDDLQWADDGSLEILERVAEKLINTATLIIVSYRDTEVGQSHPLAQLIKKLKNQSTPLLEIPVRNLTLKETTQMIAQIIMEKEERVLALAEILDQKAKGNPFFTLELLRSLVDSEIIYLEKDHYTYDLEKLKAAGLPENIVEIVLKRIKDLPEEHLQVLSYASVLGKELQFELITELTKKPFEAVLNSIEEGIKNQLLMRDITGRENIFFMHDRIREALYQRVSEQEREPLHKHIAEVLEEQNKDNPDPVIYDLAYHFTQARVDDKALQYSIPAAHKAKSSYANTLAIDLYNSAKDILEKQDKIRTSDYTEILENLGEVYRLAGKFDLSITSLKEAEALIPKTDTLHKAQVLSKMGDTYWDNGKVEESAKILEQSLRVLGIRIPVTIIGVLSGITIQFSAQMLHMLFPQLLISGKYRESPHELLIVRIMNRLGHAYYYSDMNKTLYYFLRCLNVAEKIGPCSELAYAYISAMPVFAVFPWHSRVERDYKKGLEISQKLNDRVREGIAYGYYAGLRCYSKNKGIECLSYAKKAVGILKPLGEYWELGVGYAFINHGSFIAGNMQEAIKINEESMEVMKQANVLQPLGWGLYDKGSLSSLIGDVSDEIIESIKEGNRLMIETRDKADEAYSLSILAFAYLRRKEYALAIETVEKAIPMYDRLKGPWSFDLFTRGAQIYLDTVVQNPEISRKQKDQYLKRARWFILQSRIWSVFFKFFYGWTLQVSGTYLWLTGKKKRAISTWDRGVKYLREKSDDKYRIAYILLEQAKFLLSDKMGSDPIIRKKAYSNLIEARDLFTEMGCKLDLDTANKLLESISPEGISVDSRTVLTQKRHLDSLLQVTQAIGSIFILDELLQKILEYGLKVTGAERGFLLLYDQTKNLSLKVSSGLEKDLSGTSFSYDNYRISLELINEVVNTKSASIADQQTASNAKIQNELKTFSVRQAITVPLQTRDKPIGILYMDNRLAGGTFGKDELELMKGFAVQASVSIENAFLVSSLVEQERLKQELELGRQIQESLLPKESPVIQGLKLSGLMLPAKEIGGDYYDFVIPEMGSDPISQAISSVGIVIGDVSGKGVAAGLLMAMAKTAIHTLSQEETSPKQILLRTNQILVKHIGAQKFMTMLYFRYDTQTKTLTYSSAGHEHILIYRNNGKVESIISGGFMLGMVPDISAFLEDKQISLNPGDKIILYTDGVTEARNPQEDLFGLEKLIELIQKYGSKPAEQLLNSIKEEVYSYIGTREQYDDITLVVMEAT
ncbi:MAG: SpoIIE family protein phosphatase, partial [Candidatus Omnitrophica bacterium]|nr:SpoIIE family protein phosphatase [Candidatus Omnitrophota bacterium]